MSRSSQPVPPRLPNVQLGQLAPGDFDLLRAEDDRDNERFGGVDLGGRDLTGVTFSECGFVDVSLDDADLLGVRFNDCVLTRVNAPILRASRSSWRSVIVEHSRIGSGELYDSGVNAIHFSHCKISYLNLRGSKLRDVLFTECTIDELDLAGATAARVAFQATPVRLLDVARANLTDVDLRGADLGGIRGIDSLRGTTMTEYQLAQLSPLFAEYLGVTIAS
jgi:uncharacterized protein YjbI with pentapeptide repeats